MWKVLSLSNELGGRSGWVELAGVNVRRLIFKGENQTLVISWSRLLTLACIYRFALYFNLSFQTWYDDRHYWSLHWVLVWMTFIFFIQGIHWKLTADFLTKFSVDLDESKHALHLAFSQFALHLKLSLLKKKKCFKWVHFKLSYGASVDTHELALSSAVCMFTTERKW